MRIEGLNQNVASFHGTGGNEEAAIQRKMQSLKKELGELEKKDELTQEEAKRKKELERQIAELAQKLQQIKADQAAEKSENPERPKEDGKGENVDERI